MINPPDELLEDLQSALPPEQPVTSPASDRNQDNGHHDHLENFYDHMSHAGPERASMGSNSMVRVGWDAGPERASMGSNSTVRVGWDAGPERASIGSNIRGCIL